jgi:hypothetical protein
MARNVGHGCEIPRKPKPGTLTLTTFIPVNFRQQEPTPKLVVIVGTVAFGVVLSKAGRGDGGSTTSLPPSTLPQCANGDTNGTPDEPKPKRVLLRPRRCHGCEMTRNTMAMSCIICSLRYALAVLYHREGGCPTPMNLWVSVPLDHLGCEGSWLVGSLPKELELLADLRRMT